MEKQRLRFTLNDDIVLLKEVLSENPFEKNEKWEEIKQRVNEATLKPFTIRCLREHLLYLMASFKKQDCVNKKKSGTEEEYTELHILIQDVIDLSNEFKENNRLKKKRKPINPGILARKQSMIFSQLDTSNELFEVEEDSHVFDDIFPEGDQNQSIASVTVVTEDSGSADCPPSSSFRTSSFPLSNQPSAAQLSAPLRPSNTRRRNPMIEYLREKQQIERAMKKEELAVQNKRLRLEEATLAFEKEKLELEKERLEFDVRKFETEAKEREMRLELELEERRERLKGEREQRELLFEQLKSVISK